MITFSFDDSSRKPKYEQLYDHIKARIVAGVIHEGKRLPSKRKLAAHLHIALNTVENAYAQLLAEGYIESVEKRGYYAMPLRSRPSGSVTPAQDISPPEWVPEPERAGYVLQTNAVDTSSFPFATWSRLMRESLRADHARLVQDMHPQGDRPLREVIATYLYEYRNMTVSPDNIVIGAGTTYLLGMVSELLGKSRFAIEDPGYPKLAGALRNRPVPYTAIPVDKEGMSVRHLMRSGANVPVVTPSNQFPLSLVMSIKRRLELLAWAKSTDNRYIIEDDYDSDYRYSLRPAPALHSLDRGERVIYLNTFARTLTPSLRIAYMVLPAALMEVYWSRRSLYSCTVSGFEQRTLYRFIAGGQYERHLNRMRTIYKRRRNAFLDGLRPLQKKIRVAGAEAGLHLLLSSTTGKSEAELVRRAASRGVTVYGLSGFHEENSVETGTVLAGYGGYSEAELREAASRLCLAWKR